MFETILEKYTMEVVINRTKISRKNLEKLREKDFSGFTRPQAYGFIKILEREFGEDFSDLKAELDAFLEEVPTSTEPLFPLEEREAQRVSGKWIVVGLLVVVILLGGYLFRKEFASRSDENVSEQHIAVETAAASAKTEKEGNPAPAVEAPHPAESAAVVPESNVTETVQPAVAAVEENLSTAPEKETEAYVPLEPVALTPVVKLWFGTIDLKSRKRKAKVTASPYEIDSHGRKLLVTGHGRFEISDAFGNLFKFNDAKKHYFLIDDGMVKEITASEFKRLNGGKGW